MAEYQVKRVLAMGRERSGRGLWSGQDEDGVDGVGKEE